MNGQVDVVFACLWSKVLRDTGYQFLVKIFLVSQLRLQKLYYEVNLRGVILATYLDNPIQVVRLEAINGWQHVLELLLFSLTDATLKLLDGEH